MGLRKKALRILPVVVLVGTMAGTGVGHADEVPVAQCGGAAPVVKTCTTGRHTILGAEETTVALVEPVVYGSYRGRVRTILNGYGSQTVDFYCDYVGDAQTDAVGDNDGSSCTHTSSAFPTLGATFTQTCYSYNLGTFTLGGSGQWICGVTHS